MSFVRTMATLAVGFAAARGVQKVQQMGGLSGVSDALRGAGAPGGTADQMSEMAQKMGLPVEKEQMRALFAGFGQQAAQATEATEKGMASLMGALGGAASTGARGAADMATALTAGTAAGATTEDNARLMIRAMIQAARADGEIDADERQVILDALGDATEEEMQFVLDEMQAPVDPAALAADAAEGMGAQVYAAALMAIVVDTTAEREFLARLAASLNLSPQTVARLHEAQGKAAP